MSQFSTYIAYQPHEDVGVAPAEPEWVEPRQRSVLQPILLFIPFLFALIGYLAGAPPLVDLAFVVLTVLCTIFVVQELYYFSERFGVGGLVLYGGVLIWFCYDYLTNWSLGWLSGWNLPFTRDTIAKSVACHMLLILCMSIGLRFRRGRWVYQLTAKLPEPHNQRAWLWVIIFAEFVGLIPYSLFTAEPFFQAIFHQIIAGRSSLGVLWTVGRTGNANYSWGGYVAQMLQVGTGGGILAAFYAIFLSRSWVSRTFCWLVWALWLAIGFGSGTRGDVLFMALPAVGFLFIRYNAVANELMHRFSFRAYASVAVLLVLALFLVQTQAGFRDTGFEDVDFSAVDLTHLEGNAMFSEGLVGFSQIPEHHYYFYGDYPGETVLLPIPVFTYWLLIHPVPRALWTTKPIDPVGPWYNAVALGKSGAEGGNVEGETISKGLAGSWFFRFGIPGLIEGGLLYGWMMGLCERIILNCNGKVLPVLFGLGLATWLFRNFRDITYPEFYAMAIGIFALAVFVVILRPFTGASPVAADAA